MEIDKPTFQYLMDFYHLKKVPIFYNGEGRSNAFVGYLTRDLKYERNQHGVYLTRNEYAIVTAFKCFEMVLNVVRKMIDKETRITAVVIHHNEKWGDGWTKVKEETEETIEGTFDEVCENFERMNDRLRYCNGCYYNFKDKAMEREQRIWYCLISEWRSFKIYYGNGVVD